MWRLELSLDGYMNMESDSNPPSGNLTHPIPKPDLESVEGSKEILPLPVVDKTQEEKSQTSEFKHPSSGIEKTDHGTADCKEKIIEVVREIHQTAKGTGGVDPKSFENENTRYVFKGTEEELCNLIREVVFEDEETKVYAEKTDQMLKTWDEALTREEEENAEREQLIKELESELELLRIEYETVCQQRKPKESKATGAESKATSAQVQRPAANKSVEDSDDDIEIIEEIKLKPAVKRVITGMECFAVRSGDLWKRGSVIQVIASSTGKETDEYYKVRLDRSVRVLKRHQIAYEQHPKRSVMRGTRIIALYKESTGAVDYYSGIVAEPPYTKNNNRYLVFFDDGCAQYTKQSDIRVIVHQYDRPWDGLQEDLAEFVKHYMETYNQRMILKLNVGQTVSCEKDGKWLKARCLRVDCSLVKILFESDNTTEWIYRGSTRFEPLYGLHQKREAEAKARAAEQKMRPEYYTKSSNVAVKSTQPQKRPAPGPTQKPQKILNYKAPSAQALTQRQTNRPQYKYMPFIPRDEHAGNRIKVTYPNVPEAVYVAHMCGPGCIKTSDDPLRYKGKYSLTIPIYVGFERYIARTKRTKSHYTSNKKYVVYRAPCGRRIRNNKEMGDYLFITKSRLCIDMFSFEQALHLFEPFVATNIMMSIPDISTNKEQVPISCVNALNTAKPDPLVYSGVRMPQKDVDLNTNTDYMVCCDCIDNCQDKTKCACQQLTFEGQQFLQPSLPLEKSGYIYRRLDENIITGVYECNSKCVCKKTCFNRVVQHPLSVRLQIFKTEKRGWGLRCLDDVPNGGFICIYAGQLLSEEGADQGGREYGDEYFAELDFIETCENVKEGYEEDVNDPDASSDEEKYKSDSEWEGSSSGSEANDANSQLRKSLRTKTRTKKSSDATLNKSSEKADKPEEKLPVKSIRSYYNEDLPYVMDAKTSGNLGRYLNHSCDPNVFVQNVFVDTHDPRFPWIAFFANTFIRAGSELTWDYGYQPGIVEGKVMYCYCGSSNCRGRLL